MREALYPDRAPSQTSTVVVLVQDKLGALEAGHGCREHDGIDFLDFVRTCSKVRGYQCGTKYAEGFRLSENYLRIVPRRMLP